MLCCIDITSATCSWCVYSNGHALNLYIYIYITHSPRPASIDAIKVDSGMFYNGSKSIDYCRNRH